VSQNDAWKLPRPGDCCAGCQQPLLAGMLCTTVVRLHADAPLREDLCTACGERAVADPEVCFWTRRRPESGNQRAVVDYAMLRELFGRMLQRSDEVYRRLSYLVALVLIRKRFLRLVGFQRRAGREVMVVTRGAGQPTVDVPAPLLTAEDLLSVRDQLAQLMNADLADHELPELAALRPAQVDAALPGDTPSDEPATADSATPVAGKPVEAAGQQPPGGDGGVVAPRTARRSAARRPAT
jgi:hypothetical protein